MGEGDGGPSGGEFGTRLETRRLLSQPFCVSGVEGDEFSSAFRFIAFILRDDEDDRSEVLVCADSRK